MNIFTNLVFTFIFLNLITFFKFPDVTSRSFIKNKSIIFIAMFFFQMALDLIAKMKNKCKINMKIIVEKSLMISLYSILGYSCYTDLIHMERTQYFFQQHQNVQTIAVCIIIIIFLAAIRALEVIFTNESRDKCEK